MWVDNTVLGCPHVAQQVGECLADWALLLPRTMHRCIAEEVGCHLWDGDQALDYAVGIASEADVLQAYKALQARPQAQLQDRSSCKHGRNKSTQQ